MRIPAIGTLRDRVQLLRKDVATEAGGGGAVTYFPLASVWARVTKLNDRTDSYADARRSHVNHSVVIRYRNDVSVGDRISYRGRNLEVVGADDLNGRRAYLSCACVEHPVRG